MMLPWTIRGPRQQTDEHGQDWWEIRVVELPEFFVAAESKDEEISEYSDALEAFLESYVERGEEPAVLPTPTRASWQIQVYQLQLTSIARFPTISMTLPMLRTGSLRVLKAELA